MNGIKKIGGDDIEMPKRSRADSELFCKLNVLLTPERFVFLFAKSCFRTLQFESMLINHQIN
jgi:hypothetical protein